MKKILVNFVTLGKTGIDTPRLLKFQELEKLGGEWHLFSGEFLKKMQLIGKDIYLFNKNFSELEKLSDPGKTKIRFLFFALKRNIRALRFLKEVKKEKYDLIYSPAAVLDLILFPFIYKMFDRKVKWVVVFDNLVPFWDPGNKFIRFLAWFFYRISLFLIRKADCVFVISKDLQEYLLKKGFSREKIVLSTNGVDNELIEKARPDLRYNIDALFMGRINETKGIYDMLKALDLVRRKYPHFQLAIMGEGDEVTEKQFKKKIKEMGLENNVKFLGFRSGIEKFNILKSAKCFWFLSVSESESFGVALLEAVVSGIPTFAYDLPQFHWLYPNGEVNILPKGDWQAVARQVIELFEKGNFINEKGKKLLGKYSWKKAAKVEYEVIKNL
jgi:glycosyltransferase involved in cell wall biosynthesis